MTTTIADLKGKLARELSADDLRLDIFELLQVSCSACCTQHTGGNESCPPKEEAEIQAN